MDLEELRKEMEEEVTSASFKERLKERKNKKKPELSTAETNEEINEQKKENITNSDPASLSVTANKNISEISIKENSDKKEESETEKSEQNLPDWAKSSKTAKPQKKSKPIKHKKNPISPAVAIIFLIISTAAAVGTVFLCYWAYDAMKIILTQTGPAVIIFFFFCWTPFIIPLLTAIATVITYTMALTCGIMSRHSVLGKVILVIALIPVIALILVIILPNV